MKSDDVKNWREKLVAIQWITSNQQFNEHQHVKLGNAIAAFNDCIEKNDAFSIKIQALSNKAKILEEMIQAEREEKERITRLFEQHLDTMSEINAHMGYPFTQPLINARKALGGRGD